MAIDIANPMYSRQVARPLNVSGASVSKWIRSGCPAPPCKPHNKASPRVWHEEDLVALRAWLDRRRTPRLNALTTTAAARVLNCAKFSLLRWQKKGCPVPEKPRGQRERLWRACDLAAARRWLEQRKNRGGGREGTGANARSEAAGLFRCIGRDGATAEFLLRSIEPTTREVEVMRKITGGTYAEAALSFRRQVRREFVKLLEKEKRKKR